MSKVRVDQLSPTDDSVTVNVKDIEVVNRLAADDSANSNILNVAQAIKERKYALTSNTHRLATWNVACYLLVNPVDAEHSSYADTSRFNRNYSSQQFIREHIEWFLKVVVDFAAIQEFYGK